MGIYLDPDHPFQLAELYAWVLHFYFPAELYKLTWAVTFL